MTISLIRGELPEGQHSQSIPLTTSTTKRQLTETSGFAPSRLLWAREHRMITRSELAHAAGISVSAIAGYEQGRTTPSQSTQEKLTNALNLKPHFLSLEDLEEVPAAAVSFRKASKIPKKHQHAARGDARMAVEIFNSLEKHFKLPSAQIPALPRFKPVDAAELVRAEWHLGDRPISDMMSLLESKGVRILSLDHRYSDVDAFCFTRDGVPYIFVSTAKSGERQRFDLAHELGHLVMHSGDDEYPSSKEREKEAQDFASAFLLPASRIYTQGMHDAHLDRILEAKAYWGVSAMAMTYRLHDLGLLSDWQYRTAAVELTKRGYRASEPDGITPERSQLLHKVFHSLGGYRMVQDIADTIGLRREDILVYLRDLVMRAV